MFELFKRGIRRSPAETKNVETPRPELRAPVPVADWRRTEAPPLPRIYDFMALVRRATVMRKRSGSISYSNYYYELPDEEKTEAALRMLANVLTPWFAGKYDHLDDGKIMARVGAELVEKARH